MWVGVKGCVGGSEGMLSMKRTVLVPHSQTSIFKDINSSIANTFTFNRHQLPWE